MEDFVGVRGKLPQKYQRQDSRVSLEMDKANVHLSLLRFSL